MRQPAQAPEYVQDASLTIDGLVTTATNPRRAVRSAEEQFHQDPADFAGRALPGPAGAGGMVKAVRGGLGAGAAAKGAVKSVARKAADERPTEGSRSEEKVCRGTDPVDLATGRMFLPQTDVSLPGALPLVFRRRAESGYRLGQWFGPSWSSTVDQRLEIDAKGIVFVHEDGLVPAYPHPAGPGEPVLPERGPRRPLERTADGAGYTISDPEAGRAWHFAERDGFAHGSDSAHGSGGDDAGTAPAGAAVDGLPGVRGDGGPGVRGDAVPGVRLALLEQIDDRNGHWITFAYAPEDGVPVSVTHSGGHTRHFLINDAHQVIAESDRLDTDYLAAEAPDEEIATRFFAIATDSVGTPTELIDEQGTVAWRTRTTLWGTTTWNRSATTYTPLRFPGQYFDPESGLHYNYFRTYDPETARYLTADPLGLAPAPNPATYVRNPGV